MRIAKFLISYFEHLSIMNKYFFFVFLLLLLFIQSKAFIKSCKGFCNSNKLVQNECMCNDDCIHNNNCCIDFFMICTSENIQNNSLFNETLMNESLMNKTLMNETYTNYLRKNINKNYEQEQENNLFNIFIYLHLFIIIVIFNVYLMIKN